MKQKILDIIKAKGTGFTVPETYFDQVEAHVMSELSAKNLPSGSGFTHPTNYFDTLENRLMQRLTNDVLPKDQGFAVPEAYFESVEDAVFDKLDIKSSELSDSDIPKDYFDTLEDRVFAKLAEEENQKTVKVISLGARLKKVWAPVAVAASLALLFAISGTFGSRNAEQGVSVAELEEVLSSFDSYELAEVFSDVDLAANESINEEDELLDYLNGTDVESMLLEN